MRVPRMKTCSVLVSSLRLLLPLGLAAIVGCDHFQTFNGYVVEGEEPGVRTDLERTEVLPHRRAADVEIKLGFAPGKEGNTLPVGGQPIRTDIDGYFEFGLLWDFPLGEKWRLYLSVDGQEIEPLKTSVQFTESTAEHRLLIQVRRKKGP